MSIYEIGKQKLSISVVNDIITENKKLVLASKAKNKIKDCRDYLDKNKEFRYTYLWC